MTAKECGHDDDTRKTLYRHLLIGAISLIATILFIILLVYLILKPQNPHFILQDATVFAFNVTSPNILTSNIQITLSSRNPNHRIGIYYDSVHVYATYRNQEITLPTLLPSTYQGHMDFTVWSPFVYGTAVPIAPYLGDSLAQDQIAGTVMINIRANGRVRWKVGTFVSGGYHLNVNCPAYLTFGNKNNGFPVGPAVKYQLAQSCEVDV